MPKAICKKKERCDSENSDFDVKWNDSDSDDIYIEDCDDFDSNSDALQDSVDSVEDERSDEEDIVSPKSRSKDCWSCNDFVPDILQFTERHVGPKDTSDISPFDRFLSLFPFHIFDKICLYTNLYAEFHKILGVEISYSCGTYDIL
jgi:hypothetical protein